MEVEVGDTIYFFRVWSSTRQDKARRAQKGEFLGPATVFGIQHNRIWVQYGGHAFCVARKHIRVAGPDENSLRAGLVKEQMETFKDMPAGETYTDLTQQAPDEQQMAAAAEKIQQQADTGDVTMEIDPSQSEDRELEPTYQELASKLRETGSFTMQLPSGELAFGQRDAWRLRLPAASANQREESEPARHQWHMANTRECRVLSWIVNNRPPKNARHGQGLRTYVFGLYTRQGIGVTQQTRAHGQDILGCLHELASIGEGPAYYTTLVVNVLEASDEESPCIRLHQDKYNMEGVDNHLMEMGSYEGGRIWLEGQEGKTPCPFDSTPNGKWVAAKHRWTHFDARKRHCVTAVTNPEAQQSLFFKLGA
eukprot:2431414-Amphidinium_carterae.1